jgi:TatA/E family protein of Tat protein translocase
MFNLGTWEILLILGAALIFIGPDKLPKVAKSLGKGVRQVRDAMSQVDTEVKRATSEARKMVLDDEDPTAPDAETAAEMAADAAAAKAVEAKPAPVSAPGHPPAAAETTSGGDPPPNADPLATDASERDWNAHLSKGPQGRVAAARPGAPPRPSNQPASQPATASPPAPVGGNVAAIATPESDPESPTT